jgi:thymidylate kinase
MKNRKIIVFIGTDGTGKTTVSTELGARLLSDDAEYVYLGMKHYKFELTQTLHDSSSRVMQYLFKYIAYPFDIFSKKINLPANKNIIIDRLPGYPFANSNKLVKLIYSLAIPKIDCLIWLHGSPEVIYLRKKERDIDGLVQDQKKIGLVFERVAAAKKIDICVDVLTVDEIIDIVLKESQL